MNTTELQKLAEAATPGPWMWDSDPIKGDPLDRVRFQVVARGRTITQCYYSSGDPMAQKEASYIAAANPAAILKLLAINAELVEALKGLDEAYCRAGPQLTRDERNIDRKRLIIARAALAKAEGGEL